MNTISELIERLGGTTRFAAIIGKNYSTASEMKRRASIPIDYWPVIISAAAEKGLVGVNNDLLVALHLSARRESAVERAPVERPEVAA